MRAFTLIELLTAVAIFAIVLAAINTVFYTALRLRNRTSEAVDAAQSVDRVLTILRHDLQGIVAPGGRLAGGFKIGLVSNTLSLAQSPGIEFFSSTGIIDDQAPWGDIQKVVYQLREPMERSRSSGMDLVRSVTRNLLATTVEEALTQRLMNNVETLEFLGYNGMEWRPTWDTTLSDTNLPTAVRVRILLAGDPEAARRSLQPLEMIVPIVVQGPTNLNSVTTGGQQ